MAGTDVKTLRLLAVEDDPADQSWMLVLLEEATLGPYHISFVPTMADAEMSLQVGEVDCVLLDLSLPDSWGVDSVKRILAVAPKVPVVVITGSDDQTQGLQAIEKGAHDYLVKGKVSGDGILRAARWAAARAEAVRRRLPRADSILDLVPAAWATVNDQAVITLASPAFLGLVGQTEAEAVGAPFATYLAVGHLPDTMRCLHQVLTDGPASLAIVTRLARPDGSVVPQVLTAVRVVTPDDPNYLLVALSELATTGPTAGAH